LPTQGSSTFIFLKQKKIKELKPPTLATYEKKTQHLTMYKKHRAFVLTPKFCAYLQSPLNIKLGI